MNNHPIYAWEITRDHLAEVERRETGQAEDDAAGTRGPSTAPDDLIARLAAGEGETFRLHDDDGELYYTGRLVVANDDDWGSEEVCSAPLGDFGAGWAGCTVVRWDGHPTWEVG